MRSLTLGLTVIVAFGMGWLPTRDFAADPDDLNDWAEGPVRWLLQPSERREMRQVQDPEDAALFIEQFWSRRDPRPQEDAERPSTGP